jgi:hypothetical protein
VLDFSEHVAIHVFLRTDAWRAGRGENAVVDSAKACCLLPAEPDQYSRLF